MGSGSSESLGSIKLGRKIGVAGTIGDGAGNVEGDKVTLGDGGAATRRAVGSRSGAGGGRTMAWSKMLSRSSMARSWELPSLAKGAAGVGYDRALARAQAATTSASAEGVLEIGQDAKGKLHCLGDMLGTGG